MELSEGLLELEKRFKRLNAKQHLETDCKVKCGTKNCYGEICFWYTTQQFKRDIGLPYDKHWKECKKITLKNGEIVEE
jgi:hypothetical protein